MPTTTSSQTQTQTPLLSPEQQAILGQRGTLVGSYLAGLNPGSANPFTNTSVFSTSNPWAMTPESAGLRTGALSYLNSAVPGMAANPFTYDGSSFVNSPLLNKTMGLYDSFADTLKQPAPVYTPVGSSAAMPSGGVATAGQTTYDPRATTYTPADLAKYISQFQSVSPDAAIKAATDIMSNIVSPGLLSQLASKGQGRSGAEDEAIAQAGTAMALPIAQQTQSQEADRQKTIFLQQTAASLQAQMLTAKSESERQALKAQLDQVNAQLQTQASVATAGNQTSASIAGSQQQMAAALQAQLLTAQSESERRQIMASWAAKGLDLGTALASQGAQYGLAAPGAIMDLYGKGLSIGQLPNTLAQGGMSNQEQFLLGLLGMQPMPNNSSQTTSSNGSTTNPTNWAGMGALGLLGAGQIPWQQLYKMIFGSSSNPGAIDPSAPGFPGGPFEDPGGQGGAGDIWDLPSPDMPTLPDGMEGWL